MKQILILATALCLLAGCAGTPTQEDLSDLEESPKPLFDESSIDLTDPVFDNLLATIMVKNPMSMFRLSEKYGNETAAIKLANFEQEFRKQHPRIRLQVLISPAAAKQMIKGFAKRDFGEIPLGEAVRYFCSRSMLSYQVDRNRIIFHVPGELFLPTPVFTNQQIKNMIKAIRVGNINLKEASINAAIKLAMNQGGKAFKDKNVSGIKVYVTEEGLDKEVTLQANNESLADFLDKICKLTNMKYVIKDGAVYIIGKKQSASDEAKPKEQQ